MLWYPVSVDILTEPCSFNQLESVLFDWWLFCSNPFRRVTTKFIVNILKSPRASQVESTAALRQWAKCCTLTTNLNDVSVAIGFLLLFVITPILGNILKRDLYRFVAQDIRELTHLIMKLDSYKILSDATPEEFFKSREPLSVFFNSCGKKYYKSSEEQKKLIASRLQQTVAGFEKWTSMTDSPIVLYKIHMISGFLIYNCPHIVYARVCIHHFVISCGIRLI